MGDWIKLKADDGHELSAYVAKPENEPVGAVVVVQEIFGVNPSIRTVAYHYATQGFLGIAPAIFDRYERNVELGYSGDDLNRAFKHFYPMLDPNVTILDIAAAFHHAKQEGKPTAVLGFCYGGLTSWVSAVRGENVRMQPDCCVCYYPGGIGKFAQEEPACPVLIHVGSADDHVGDQVEAVRSAHPEVEIHIYEGAPHAFANPDRPSYKADAAKLADQRSLEFLRKHLA